MLEILETMILLELEARAGLEVLLSRVTVVGKRKFSNKESDTELSTWWALFRETLLNEKLMSYLRLG